MNTILVIEDEAQIRENIAEILAFTGFEVITAENGATGLELAKSRHPDLIICDIMMPTLDGYQVLDALRQNARTATIPLIFLTAKVDRGDQRHGMNLGADDYLTKPFEPEELLLAIESRLNRRTALNQYIAREQQKVRKLRYSLQHNQQKLQVSQKQEEIKADLLQRLIQDLREPVSNLNLATQMLENATSQEARDRYLKILKTECDRQTQLLHEFEQLQALLTPETTKLLQHYRIIDP
ncbi:response regulator [Leptolyngbya sp. AN10]|uniref:response regulator transcription factor n=1 Tax=Leptolyngbya sp. AN10 TaxID=3423365 RepID=UPI003D3150AA